QQTGQPAGVVAEAVEVRVDDQVAIAGPETDDVAPDLEAAEVLGVRRHHALRLPRGAGGEEDVGEVVGRDRRGARLRARVRDRVAAREEIVPPDRAGGGS